MSFGKSFKKAWLDTFQSHSESMFEGCTQEEINFLMQKQGVSYLPKVYRDLLKVMGRSGIYRVLEGDCTYYDLHVLKDRFDSITERENLKYPADIFVFNDHQGYIFYFFRTKGTQKSNPPVYGYHDAWEGFSRLSDSLSGFFIQQLEWKKHKTGPDLIQLETGLDYDMELDVFDKR